MSDIVWRPTAAQIESARVTDFRRQVNMRYGLALDGYGSLYDWSVRHPARFWSAVWRFCGVISDERWDDIVSDEGWFRGARLNFAENLLQFNDDGEALVYRREDGLTRRLTFAEMRLQVARLAASLKADGIAPGDRVAAFLPNRPETVIAMLATASLGAVWSSCSPDFGEKGVLDRFGQIEPKVLFCTDRHPYGGRFHESASTVRSLLGSLASIETTVIIGQGMDLPGAVLWEDYLASGAPPLTFEQLPFDHPLCIMYSSGTTGLPKCMVHSAGGTLLQHLKEHQLHCDLRRGDRIFYFTTCGWMMWNWLVSALATGATVVLYDGSPMRPETALWDLSAEENISIFGTSAKYLAACEKGGLCPRSTHDLSSLNSILSTGSPLAPEQYDWVYDHVKEEVRLSSISGGTDIISCFALGSPVLPVRRGELQCRGLGMDVAVFDDDGTEIIGEPGELVCRLPFPSQPTGFWNDPDGSKYHSAYFERFPGVWAHGDWAELRPEGGMIIYGRSDAVLNPGGVRIGTAEIYRIVESFDEIVESIAVGQDWENDVRILLFVVLREGCELNDELRDRIKGRIREQETPRHVPAKIIAVPEIPRTISGKIVELAVRDIIHGREVTNRDALANPQALDYFEGVRSRLHS